MIEHCLTEETYQPLVNALLPCVFIYSLTFFFDDTRISFNYLPAGNMLEY